ncbi:MAG: tripartite tricarboxylate transporter permease [SAR202 cluster bacterium]|nr:tripartite tricarboxylate transporter permease [SAR202 cluster bacterium]|tara:strand:+ start:8685 stop:10817 length:2133 start_codon:yes stop_codon:yes gene_type:complete
MLEAAGEALSQMASWQVMLALMIGVAVGVLNGAMPGGAVPSLVVLLGFAYGQDPYIALPLAVGMVATVSTGDTLPAVLLGMPGSTSGQATILDGNPLARQGKAGVALSAAYFASMIGGIVGGIFLFITIPAARTVVNSFSAAEFFVLGLVAVGVVGIVSSGALIRGLMAGCLGLLIALVGFDDSTGVQRLTFGFDYLWDGFHIVPVVIGLFALPEFFDMLIGNVAVSRQSAGEISTASQRWEGMKAVLKNWPLVFRSAGLGVFVGVLPGIGGSLAQWLAYASARQTVKGGTETFGTGDIRGVIAPESSNNAVDGGQLVPTLFFGVPGSVGMAIFLGLLVILDVQPGPSMLNENLDLTLTIAFSLVVANILGTGLALGFTPTLTRIAFVPPNILVPIILGIMTIAAFQASFRIQDLVVMLGFGGLGYFMKTFGWPRPPIVISVILGGIVEKYYGIASKTFGMISVDSSKPLGIDFGLFSRIPVLLIILIALGTAGYTLWMQRNVGKTQEAQAVQTSSDRKNSETNMVAPKPSMKERFAITPSGVFIGLMAIAFAFSLYSSYSWTEEAAKLPKIITSTGLVLVAIYIARHLLFPSTSKRKILDIGRTVTNDSALVLWIRTFKALGTTVGLIFAIYLIGFQIAVPTYVFLFLKLFGKVRWWVALLWSIFFLVLIYGFFDLVIHIAWIDPALENVFPIPDVLKGRETITEFFQY